LLLKSTIMRAYVVLAVLVAVALASSDVDVKLDAHANLTDAAANFAFRYTGNFPVPTGVLNLLAWTSVSVDAAAATQEAKASADAMVGIGFLPGTVNAPFSLLVYGNGTAAVDVNAATFAQGLIGGKLDAAFKGGVVAMAALGMQEFDPDNKPVGKLVTLEAPVFSPCIPKIKEDDDKNVYIYTCTYSPDDTSADVTTTYVTSKIAGILEYGQTPVSPRSFEMIIEVENFNLKDKKNHVRMFFGLLTASGAGSVEGNANVVHRGEGQDDLYVAASKYAVVDGDRVDVTVEVASGANTADAKTMAVLKAALGINIDAQIATVDFPAGATSFVYDPVVGAGAEVYQAGASTAVLSLLVLLVSVLIYLF